MAGRFLMRGGLDVATSGTVVSRDRARRINALMLTCGHYGASGDFAYRVGLPSKSGVGGGILAIDPGRASIAVWSPGLNANGNPLLGTWALQRLSEGHRLVGVRSRARPTRKRLRMPGILRTPTI